MLSSAFNIARSGLAAEALRVEVAASNIANASSPDYVPLQVSKTALGHPGGVATTVRPVLGTDLSGTGSNVDIAREITTLVEAQAAYKANLAVIVTVDEMMETLLDVVGHDHSHEHRD
ncbi:MAG: flagellar basal body rod protein FlgC [Hyphomicrobiaceae bacterium]